MAKGRAIERAWGVFIMALSTAQLSLIEQRVTNDGPSTGTAYLLWFFLGIISAHRFYLGRPLSAVIQILTYFILVGFVWLLIDGLLIPGMIREKRDQIRKRLTTDMLAMGGGRDAAEAA